MFCKQQRTLILPNFICLQINNPCDIVHKYTIKVHLHYLILQLFLLNDIIDFFYVEICLFLINLLEPTIYFTVLHNVADLCCSKSNQLKRRNSSHLTVQTYGSYGWTLVTTELRDLLCYERPLKM